MTHGIFLSFLNGVLWHNHFLSIVPVLILPEPQTGELRWYRRIRFCLYSIRKCLLFFILLFPIEYIYCNGVVQLTHKSSFSLLPFLFLEKAALRCVLRRYITG